MYSVYLDQKIAFDNLTKEDAENIAKEMKQMIYAGVQSYYTADQIKIIEIKP
jgi:hypothetical protein